LVSPNALNKTKEEVDTQGKQLEDLRTLMKAQNNAIVNLSEVLNEVGVVLDTFHKRSFRLPNSFLLFNQPISRNSFKR
jgi:hypothetical protein